MSFDTKNPILTEETEWPAIDEVYEKIPENDRENWFIRFTGKDRFGMNYNSNTRGHYDPVGIYAYPLGWFYKQGSSRFYGTDRPIANIFRVDLKNPYVHTTTGPKQISSAHITALKKDAVEKIDSLFNTIGDDTQKQDWHGRNWFQMFTDVCKNTNNIITQGFLTKLLLKHGVGALYDMGLGIINSAEPWQILVLDSKLCTDITPVSIKAIHNTHNNPKNKPYKTDKWGNIVNKYINNDNYDAAGEKIFKWKINTLKAICSGKVDVKEVSPETWQYLAKGAPSQFHDLMAEAFYIGLKNEANIPGIIWTHIDWEILNTLDERFVEAVMMGQCSYESYNNLPFISDKYGTGYHNRVTLERKATIILDIYRRTPQILNWSVLDKITYGNWDDGGMIRIIMNMNWLNQPSGKDGFPPYVIKLVKKCIWNNKNIQNLKAIRQDLQYLIDKNEEGFEPDYSEIDFDTLDLLGTMDKLIKKYGV